MGEAESEFPWRSVRLNLDLNWRKQFGIIWVDNDADVALTVTTSRSTFVVRDVTETAPSSLLS